MKRVHIVALSAALLAGSITSYLIYNVVSQPPPAPTIVEKPVDSTEVLVATSDIGIGQLVNEASFRWVAWPLEAATTVGYITKQNGGEAKQRDLAGSVARFALLAGEPVTAQKLIKAGQGGVVAAILPQGMRAISVPISAASAAGNLILPNDHVDVVLAKRARKKDGTDDVVSDTLFRNVRVIAIGQQIETKEGKKSAEAQTATLELTPRQTETLSSAILSGGNITLTLRSVADLSSDPQGSGGEARKEKSNVVRILRYGVKSRVYGVN